MLCTVGNRELERVLSNNSEETDERGFDSNNVWSRLHEHDRDLRDLHKNHAEVYQRIKGTEQVIANVHQELRDWKDQTHNDSNRIIEELKSANNRGREAVEKAQETAAFIRTIKWVIPTAITGTGVFIGGLTLLLRSGVLG